MASFDIFATGTPVMDYSSRCTNTRLASLRLKKGGSNFMERKKLEALCSRVKISFTSAGDNARNVCEGISYLGGKCAYAGSLAKDREGLLFAANLRRLKITSLLQALKGASGKILALITPDRQRTFAVSLGNSEKYSKIESAALKSSKCLFLTSITALSRQALGKTCAKLMQQAKKSGIPIAFSIESPPMVSGRRKGLLALLKKFPPSVLFANEEEFAALGISAKKFLSLAKTIVLKRGAKGASIFSGAMRIKIPAKKARVMDTSGAGDYFAAGFLYGMCKKKPLKECGALGASLAARAISRIGTSLA